VGQAEQSTFGALLRTYRDRRGITQEELAERAGLSVDAIGLLERGERQRPQRFTLQRLLDALALPPEDADRLAAAARATGRTGRQALPSSLPTTLTPLIGRTEEIAAVIRRLMRPDARLLTLTGPGGDGTTRLALAVASTLADRFADGAIFVPLAAVRDPALVAVAIGGALGIGDRSSGATAERIAAHLREKQLLLVIDNCEHVLPAVTLIAELLNGCPRLIVLATSRAALHLTGEQQFPVPPLAIPDTGAVPPSELAQSPAVALFVRCAEAVAPGFALTEANAGAVAEICRRIEGIPLAIELAAAWTKALPPRALLTRLERRLPLLTGGPRDLPLRLQTMRDAIAWSDDLLPSRERTLFRRLSVFVGGWTLPAAEAICTGDGQASGEILASLAALVNASLIARVTVDDAEDRETEPRFGMLETIREYAAECLAKSGEEASIRRAHVHYYVALVEQAQPHLVGPDEGEWLEILEREHANIRAALRWTLDAGEIGLAVRFAAVVWRFWAVRSHSSEGRRWLEAILAASAAGSPSSEHTVTPLERAMLLHVTGNLSRAQGDYARAWELYTECLEIRRAHHDTHGIAGALQNLGIVAFEQGEYERARSLHEAALALGQEMQSTYGIAFALSSLGDVALACGEAAPALERYEEALALFREIGHTWGVAHTLVGLGDACRTTGDEAGARDHYHHALTLSAEIGDESGIASSLEGLAQIAGARNDSARATRLFGAASALRERIGTPRAPILQADDAHALAAARAILGEVAFATVWEAGRRTPIDDLLHVALQQ
jgi:predicted ATPase/DNA-binding XRE family transcriptional regulator